MELSEGFQQPFFLLESFARKGVVYPEKEAVNLPRLVSDLDNSTIVMFLDEIQNLHLPQHNFRVVGYMQDAVESPTCPHYVTGSAMSILFKILATGSLYEPIKPFTTFCGSELVNKSAEYYGAEIPELMTPVVAERCGGNPFYINAVVQQAAKLNEPLKSEEIINKILAVDLSAGFIYGELRDQVMKWIKRLNDQNITKWILYLSALEKEERINPERIQKELKRQEGEDVDLEKIKSVMVGLSQGDLIDYKSFGDWFTHVNDPILQEFLKVWGKIEVAGITRAEVEEEIISKYESLKKKYNNYKGYLAEVFIIQILWNNQKKILDGKYFNFSEKIKMPGRFIYIAHRSKLGAGRGKEIDIYATAGSNVWVVESKWWKDPVDVNIVKNLLKQGDIVKEIRGKDLKKITFWLFASNGVTENAKKLMEENGILWSTKENLNDLLNDSDLRKLPEMD
jgi:hypothetical protein